MALAKDVCSGRVVMVHEGGYSEMHVPFLGHAVLEELSGSAIRAIDPFADALSKRQPGSAFDEWLASILDEMTDAM